MKSYRIPPYVRPNPRALVCSDWETEDNSKLLDGELFERWDQHFLLNVSRVIEIDVDMMATTGRLLKGAEIAIVPTWWSSGTGLRGSGQAHAFKVDPKEPRRRCKLQLSIPGDKLARNLQLRSALTLMNPSSKMESDILAPRRKGSILWDNAISIILEGEASRFPMTVVDFVESGLGAANSCWRFEWKPTDPDLPAMATMRLYINVRHSIFHAAMTSQNPDSAQLAIRSALKYALCDEMARLAVEVLTDKLAPDKYPPNSAGHVFADLLQRLFPDLDPIGCAAYRHTDPGAFQTDLQARIALFSDKMPGQVVQ